MRACHVLAVLGVVRDRVVHVRDAAFVDQVDDQLQFVQALEVRHFRRVACFDQRLEAGLDQLDGTAAQHGLLAEQVGFGFFTEVGFDDAGTAAAVRCRVRQRDVACRARLVLRNRDQVRHAATLRIRAANRVARCLRRDHDHVEVGARDHRAVVDVEAVRECQRRALLDVRVDFLRVHVGDLLVRQQHHHDVGALHRFRDFLDRQACVFGLAPRRAALAQADRHVHAAVLQVQRVCMALRAVADDRDLLALDEGEVSVFVVENVHDGSFANSKIQQFVRMEYCGPGHDGAPGVPVWHHTFRMRSPRPMPELPVRTVSRIAPASSPWMNASSLSLAPVNSIV